MRRGMLILLMVGLLAPLFTTDTGAEVRAVRSRKGDYRGVRVLLQSTRNARVWSPIRAATSATLNPRGDRYGDLWPLIAEPGVEPNYPWVIWSRKDPHQDYDLVWTRWTPSGWQPVVQLETTGPQRPGDDLDPDIAFDGNGRPYVVWWKDEGGVGQVYLSIYLVASWMQPYRVSNSIVDSRHPSVRLVGSDIVVRFETPQGDVERTVVFSQPATITDDIDPLDYVTAEALRYVGER